MTNKEFNNIKIPENLNEFIDKTVDTAYKKNKKNKFKKVSGIIAAGVSCFMILGIAKPTVASAIPQLQLLFESLQSRLDNGGKGVEYVTSVNQSVKNNGVEVTLTEISLEGKYLYVSYIIKSDTPFRTPDNEISETQLMYEHHEKLSFTNEALDSSGKAGLEGKFIDDNTFEGVDRYDLSSLEAEIPDSFEFEILINLFRCFPQKGDDRAELMRVGDWGFKINVNANNDSYKTIDVNSKNEAGIGIREALITSQEILVTTQHQEGTPSMSYIIDVTDISGKRLEFKDQRWNDTSSELCFNKTNLKDDKLIVNIYSNINENKGELIFSEEINLK